MSSQPPAISLNTDIGEGYGAWSIAEDDALLHTVTDANVACGFHAGDPTIMRKTCRTAAANGVAVGAQVGYRDLEGFGRRFIDVASANLINDVIYQLGALTAIASAEGLPMSFVKVHGALYHAAVAHNRFASAIVDAIRSHDPQLPVMCQPGTEFAAQVTTGGLDLIREGFIDRAYQSNGLLVPRGVEGAVITDAQTAADRAVEMAVHGRVETIDGTRIAMDVDSLCIHSDSPGAPQVAHAVREALLGAGVEFRPLVRTVVPA